MTTSRASWPTDGPTCNISFAFRRYAQGERPSLILGRVVADFVGLQVRDGEAAFGSLEQFGAVGLRALVLIRDGDRARQIEKRHGAGEVVGDGARTVIHDERNGRAGAENAAHAAGIDDHVAAEGDVPGLENGRRLWDLSRDRAATKLCRRRRDSWR